MNLPTPLYNNLNRSIISEGNIEIASSGREVVGGITGIALAGLSQSTGLATGLHEVVGHGYLGARLTHHFPNGGGPQYQVDGWDNLKAIGHARNVGDFFKQFGRFIIGYDRNHDGFGGMTRYGPMTPNELGESMGSRGRSAWLSISGSIPTLVIDSMMVAGGMQAKKYHPFLGHMLVTYGLIDHFLSSYYTWSAASMSSASLIQNAARGHDFANFAVQIGDITGVSARAVAITTATLWTAIVPVIALSLYCYQKSHATEIVPDYIALKHWLSKEENLETLDAIFNSYPKRERLLDAFNHNKENGLKSEMNKFSCYLLAELPPETVEASKKEVLAEWEERQVPDRIQKILSILSTIGKVLVVATKIIAILGQTIVPSLALVSTIFTYITPLFMGASILSSAYTTYKDLKSPDKNVPMSAKVLSVIQLVITVATEVGICVGFFTPGLNMILITSLVVGTLAGLACAYARQRIIKHRFLVLQSLENDSWNFMYQKVLDSETLSQHDREWLAYQKEAQENHWLTDEQRDRLKKVLPHSFSAQRLEVNTQQVA